MKTTQNHSQSAKAPKKQPNLLTIQHHLRQEV